MKHTGSDWAGRRTLVLEAGTLLTVALLRTAMFVGSDPGWISCAASRQGVVAGERVIWGVTVRSHGFASPVTIHVARLPNGCSVLGPDRVEQLYVGARFTFVLSIDSGQGVREVTFGTKDARGRTGSHSIVLK